AAIVLQRRVRGGTRLPAGPRVRVLLMLWVLLRLERRTARWVLVALLAFPATLSRVTEALPVISLVCRCDNRPSQPPPSEMFRLSAVREQGRWVLANALPRLTKDWERATIGRVTFVYPGSHRFDRSRAEGSARFVDSIAAAFDVPPPRGIRYYVAANLDEMFW